MEYINDWFTIEEVDDDTFATDDVLRFRIKHRDNERY